jgi:rubrerythrin
VITVSEDTGIDEAARLLVGEKIRRVPVIKRGKMVGLLSRSDVLDFFATRQWACTSCGHAEHGLQPPERCGVCSGTDFRLEKAHPRH